MTSTGRSGGAKWNAASNTNNETWKKNKWWAKLTPHICIYVCNVYGRVHIWGCECLYFFVMVCRKECCLRCNKRLSFLIVRFLRSPFDAFIFCSNKRKCKLKCKLRLNSLFFWHGPLFGSWFCWFPSPSILLLCDAFYGACFLSEHLQQNDLFNKALN